MFTSVRRRQKQRNDWESVLKPITSRGRPLYCQKSQNSSASYARNEHVIRI
jgi:hypothetical protein